MKRYFVSKLLCGFFLIAMGSASAADLKSVLVATGFSLPVAVVQSPTDPAIQFVVQQRGRIKVVNNGTVVATDFLNLVGIVSTTGGERGLLGLTFDPLYALNGYFYVNYTAMPDHATKIVRFQRSSNPLVADPNSAYLILTTPQPFEFHKGGTLHFGPDGFLYIGLGDGGGAIDPENRAQTISGSLLGKILRIDPNIDQFPADPNRNYAVPSSNPFVGLDADPEIWDCGFRNPWKFSFDSLDWLGTGALLIGDVGENQREELNYEPLASGGRNYGWRILEGSLPTGKDGENGIPFTTPFFEYDHSIGRAVTGGYVYRGTKLTGQFGRYIFADFSTGRVWSARLNIRPDGEADPTLDGDIIEITDEVALPSGQLISSVDVDSDGELFLVSYGGRYFKILPDNLIWPMALETGRYTSSEGGLRHLMASDNHALTLSEQQFFDLVDQEPSEIQLTFASGSLISTSFDLTADVSSTEPVGSYVEVLMKNQTTGQFTHLATKEINPVQPLFVIRDIPASLYRDSMGKIELKVRTYILGSPISDPFEIYLDRISLSPN